MNSFSCEVAKVSFFYENLKRKDQTLSLEITFHRVNLNYVQFFGFTDASVEVKPTNLFPGKWPKANEKGNLLPEKAIAFPSNFTIEFDIFL